MRTYGSIHSRFWTDPDLSTVSDFSKLLALYLLTGPHTTMLGCFRLPIGYVCEDLKWSSERVLKGLQELSQISFLSHDRETNWVLIKNFLRWNSIENPNQGKSIQKLFEQTPKNVCFFTELIDILKLHNKHLDGLFHNSLETLPEEFRNQDQKQEQKQDQKQKIYMSGSPEKIFKAQAKEILSFLNEKADRAYRPVDSNLKLIIARLRTGATVIDCRQVIAKKTREWKGNEKMAEYLRPATLFNATKFEQYMGELVLPKEEEQNA